MRKKEGKKKRQGRIERVQVELVESEEQEKENGDDNENENGNETKSQDLIWPASQFVVHLIHCLYALCMPAKQSSNDIAASAI